jgi:hypothetical protein
VWALLAVSLAFGSCGEHEGPGTIEGERLPAPLVAERERAPAAAARQLAERAGVAPPATQILFGDLHVHTTFSADAFMMSLPILQGEGVSPVADACDFARYCSALDFWSITDHAESLTPRRWQETKQSIRQCNAIAGNPSDPDLVAFLGWEWTQIGLTPEDHYGHKNVIFRNTEEGSVPVRPVHSDTFASAAMRQPAPLWQRVALPLLDWPNRQQYWNIFEFQRELRDVPACAQGVDTRELPPDCSEGEATPEILFEKLSQWGFDTLVIPHGTTWGIYTPPGSTWDKQLTSAQHDPETQRLIEVFSGHGNSEEYRAWRAIEYGGEGRGSCPAPRAGYEPCCWRAGEIIRSRCGDPGSERCRARVEAARQHYLDAGVNGRITVPGARVADWMGCGSCPDCFLPSFNYRPGSSVQYILALSNLERGQPERFRFGFIASSDNHSARPGTGYKEYGRLSNTDARGGRDETWYARTVGPVGTEPLPESKPFDRAMRLVGYHRLDFERQASFFMTGGLVAVHATGRSRDAIWEALMRREVYGTSGERILFWFDLLNGPDGSLPMGSETTLANTPRFRVRAAGAHKQLPGCPEVSLAGLSAERLERLCHGECYHPGDERHRIERIEIVRIRRRVSEDEPIASLIEDPWRVFQCSPNPAGCVVEFEDPDFLASGRENIYYARAIQEETPAVNAAGERCQYDERGRCVSVNPCYGDYRTRPDDDCLAPNQERAWSSPIYVGRK